MKFCVVKRLDDNTYLGQEFEEPYRYSEYTGGGGDWSTKFGKISEIIDTPENYTSDEAFRLTIFENEESAKIAAKKYEKGYGRGCELIVVNLSDL